MSVNVGHSDLVGKVRVWFSGILDFYDVARCLFGGVGLVGLATYPAPCGRILQPGGKEKRSSSKTLELFRANWKNLMQPGPRSAGLRCDWTPVDARDHAGAATLGAVLDTGGHSGPRWTWRRLARTAAALLDGSA